MVASASIKLDKLLISWLGSNAIYESVLRIIALVVSDAALMPGKNGIRPSADRTRSRTDDCNDNGNDGVGHREDLRWQSSPSPLLWSPSSSCCHLPTADSAACNDDYYYDDDNCRGEDPPDDGRRTTSHSGCGGCHRHPPRAGCGAPVAIFAVAVHNGPPVAVGRAVAIAVRRLLHYWVYLGTYIGTYLPASKVLPLLVTQR
jgi:hypothetical protein